MIQKIKHKLSKDQHLFELVKGSLQVLILKIVGMSISYISMIYITNFYGAKMFGTLTIILTVITIFSLIPRFGMESALVRIVSELNIKHHYSEIKHVAYKSILFGVIVSVLFMILLKIVSSYIAGPYFLHKPSLEEEIKFMSILIISTTIIAYIAAIFQGVKKIKIYIFLQTILTQFLFILFLLFNNILLNSNFDLFSIYVVASITASFYAVYRLFFEIKNSFKSNQDAFKMNDKYSLSSILSIAFPMLLTGSILTIMQWIDVLMLSHFTSAANIGIYTAAQKVAAITSIILGVVNAVVTPKFVEFYIKKDLIALANIVQQSTKLVFFISVPIIFILIMFAKYFMSLFGTEFISGSNALVIISIAQFVNAISGSVGYIMQMTDNQIIFRNVILIASLINILLNYLLIPMYGINGAAVATMISMAFWNLTLIIYIKKKLGFLTVYFPRRKI